VAVSTGLAPVVSGAVPLAPVSWESTSLPPIRDEIEEWQ